MTPLLLAVSLPVLAAEPVPLEREDAVSSRTIDFDPLPFFRGGPSASPFEPGHVAVEASAVGGVLSVTSGGINLTGLASITDEMGIYVSGSAFGLALDDDDRPLRNSVAFGWANVGLQHAAFQSKNTRIGYFVQAGYGVPVVSNYRRPTLDVTAGLTVHSSLARWAVDFSVPLLAVPVLEPEEAQEETLTRLADFRFTATYTATDKLSARIGFEPLPYVSFRQRVAKNLYVEPGVGILMAGFKMEGRI